MVDFRFEEGLVEGVVKSRLNRFVMLVELDGSVVECHCPSTGRIGGIVFKDVACLVSRGHGGDRRTSCTVEAVSLDSLSKRDKSWIGINQTGVNRYFEFFLRTGQLSEMVSGGEMLRREVLLGGSRIDFLVGNTFIEVKTPLISLPSRDHSIYAKPQRFNSFERLIRHFTDLADCLEEGFGAILVLCYLYDAEPFKPPPPDKDSRRIYEVARAAVQKGVGNWQVNLRVDEKGVGVIRYFKLKLF